MENTSKVTFYPVPANVSIKFEFVPGFGWYEFKWVIIGLALGGLLFLISGLFMKTTYIEPEAMTLTQQADYEEGEYVLNNEGYVEIKVNAIPIVLRVILLIFPPTMAFFLVKRDPSTNMSLINHIKGLLEFKKRQKRYMYEYNSGTEG